MPGRKYTAEQKAQAVGLSMSVGVTDAARRLDIPHRNISAWRVHPDFQYIIANHRAELSRRLNEAYALALTEVMDGLRNPKAQLGHKAKALEVLGNQRALIEGEPTERTESRNLNVNATPTLDDMEKHLLREYIRAVQRGDPVVLLEQGDPDA